MITSEKAEPISSVFRFTIPSPRYAWQENDEKNLGNCKVLQVSCKRNYYYFHLELQTFYFRWSGTSSFLKREKQLLSNFEGWNLKQFK